MENKCVSLNYMEYSFVLDSTLNEFYVNSNAFKDAILSLSGATMTSRKGVSFTSLRQGSIVAEGGVNAQSSQEVTSMIAALETNLDANGDVSGFPVVSNTFSSVSMIESLTSTESLGSKTTTGIIVGLCVLAGALITLGIIAIVKSRMREERAAREDAYKETN